MLCCVFGVGLLVCVVCVCVLVCSKQKKNIQTQHTNYTKRGVGKLFLAGCIFAEGREREGWYCKTVNK